MQIVPLKVERPSTAEGVLYSWWVMWKACKHVNRLSTCEKPLFTCDRSCSCDMSTIAKNYLFLEIPSIDELSLYRQSLCHKGSLYRLIVLLQRGSLFPFPLHISNLSQTGSPFKDVVTKIAFLDGNPSTHLFLIQHWPRCCCHSS